MLYLITKQLLLYLAGYKLENILNEISHGHTVIQYSSAVHHAEAGAISATFHQLFMSRTTDAQCNEAFSHRNPKL